MAVDARKILQMLLARGDAEVRTNVKTPQGNKDLLEAIGDDIGERVELVDDLEAEKSDVCVCGRVEDDMGHHPNSTQTPCAICGHLVWLSPISPMMPPKVCLQCVAELDEDDLMRKIGKGEKN